MHTIIPLSFLVLSLTGSSAGCGVVSGVKFTAYGFPDADGVPAYKCNGNQVVQTGPNDRTELGDGSSGNPYAAAAATGSTFKKCELLYMPLLKKYFRVQDNCSGCGKLSIPRHATRMIFSASLTLVLMPSPSLKAGRPLYCSVKQAYWPN